MGSEMRIVLRARCGVSVTLESLFPMSGVLCAVNGLHTALLGVAAYAGELMACGACT